MIRYKQCKTCGGECSREVKTLTMAQYKTWYKKQCSTRLGYKTLVRNPDKYKGRMIKVVGRVLQVQEYSGWNPYIILRVATRGSSADVMYVKINGKMGRRILESDRVTLWGEFSGLETYRSPLGESVTIPRIDAEFYSVR